MRSKSGFYFDSFIFNTTDIQNAGDNFVSGLGTRIISASKVFFDTCSAESFTEMIRPRSICLNAVTVFDHEFA